MLFVAFYNHKIYPRKIRNLFKEKADLYDEDKKLKLWTFKLFAEEIENSGLFR